MGLMSACGDDDDAEYDRRVERIDDSATTVVTRVLDEIGGERRGTGLGVHQVRGLGPPSSSAQFRVKASDLSILPDLGTAAEVFATAFTDNGWQVGEVTDSGFEGTLDDGVTVELQTGPGGLMLTISSGCVDMSSDAAEDIADRSRTEYAFCDRSDRSRQCRSGGLPDPFFEVLRKRHPEVHDATLARGAW